MEQEYKKREFCIDVECPVIKNEHRSAICKDNCQCTAYDFHDWLINNNFKIVKKGD